MKIKKIIYGLMSGAIILASTCTTVHADSYSEYEGDSSSNTYGSQNVPVSLDVSESYHVKLPAAFELVFDSTNNVFKKEDTFQVKGSIHITDYIEIGFGNSGTVEMTNGSATVDGTVTFKTGDESSQYWITSTAATAIESTSAMYGVAHKTLKPAYEAEGNLVVTVPLPSVAGQYTGNAVISYQKKQIP